jgi:hypothetical protein
MTMRLGEICGGTGIMSKFFVLSIESYADCAVARKKS